MKTKTLKVVFVLVAVLTLGTVINCGGGGGGSSPPPTGFKAIGEQWFLGSDGQFHFLSGTSVSGTWLNDTGTPTGSTTSFSGFTNSGAFMNISDGRVPANWRILANNGACFQFLEPSVRNVTAGSTQKARCVVSTHFFLTASPSSINLASPPPTVSIGGGGFTTTYGMPVVEYYDQYSGLLIGNATASSVSGDGSSLEVVTPSLSGVYTGGYNIVVSNKLADGSNTMVGIAAFSACCIDPPPPDPPDDPPPCEDICIIY
jgi:hypothetical protein